MLQLNVIQRCGGKEQFCLCAICYKRGDYFTCRVFCVLIVFLQNIVMSQ